MDNWKEVKRNWMQLESWTVKDVQKGSLTVEAAFIVSYVTMVIFLVIVLNLYLCMKTCHVLIACETAATFECTGRMKEDMEFEKQKLGLLTEKLLFSAGGFVSDAERNGETVVIRVRGSVVPPYFFSGWGYQEEIRSSSHRPVVKLRKIRALKKLFTLDSE